MVSKLAKQRRPSAKLSAGQLGKQATLDFLDEGQYEPVKQLLEEAQVTARQRGHDVLYNMLAIAYQLCLACSRYYDETSIYKQAFEAATAREYTMRQQLQLLLQLISQMETGENPEQHLPDSLDLGNIKLQDPDKLPAISLPGLWQHMKRLLEQMRGPPLPERAVSGLLPAPETNLFHEMPDEPDKPSLAVYCLGSFRVYQDGEEIGEWRNGKGKAIFKHIVANHDRPVPKTILMDTFWPDTGFESARNNLNVAVYSLRKTFRAARPDFDYILFQNDHYYLNPALTVWIDAEAFMARFKAGQRLQRKGKPDEAITEYGGAKKLYQGDFLEEDLYEDWLIPKKESLRDAFLFISERLGRFYLEKKMYLRCIQQCQDMLAKDNCREDAHRRLMRCYYQQGKRNLALRQYRLCVDALSEVLGVPPMPETTSLYKQIRNGDRM